MTVSITAIAVTIIAILFCEVSMLLVELVIRLLLSEAAIINCIENNTRNITLIPINTLFLTLTHLN
jgi:hypothetical protein